MKPRQRQTIVIALRSAEEIVAQLQKMLSDYPKPEKQVTKKFSQWDMQAAVYLNATLQVNVKGFKAKPEAELEKWADQFRLLREVDGYMQEDIAVVLKWVVQDNFWKTVIRSGSKFREKYETLLARMQHDENGRPNLL